jgi:hypothetical protein
LQPIDGRIERVEEQSAQNERDEYRLHELKKENDNRDRDESERDVSDGNWRWREWWNLCRVICYQLWSLRHAPGRCKFDDAQNPSEIGAYVAGSQVDEAMCGAHDLMSGAACQQEERARSSTTPFLSSRARPIPQQYRGGAGVSSSVRTQM